MHDLGRLLRYEDVPYVPVTYAQRVTDDGGQGHALGVRLTSLVPLGRASELLEEKVAEHGLHLGADFLEDLQSLWRVGVFLFLSREKDKKTRGLTGGRR